MSLSAEPLEFLGATVLATFVSEDLTCVTVGLLIAAGGVSPWLGLASCALGIFLGDLGLWLLGRLSREGALRWSWLKRRLPQSRLEGLGRWLDANCGQAVLAARFLPGTRFPLYVAAGALGRDGGRFAFWALVASLLWVPLLVGSVAWILMKALGCDDGGGTQPPPVANPNRRPSPCAASCPPPTPDSTPAWTCTPGPSSSASSTATATSASPAT